MGLSVHEKKLKIDFINGGHLGFPIGAILAIFDLCRDAWTKGHTVMKTVYPKCLCVGEGRGGWGGICLF